MRLWTIQLARWRLAKELGVELLDITVKSGEQTFAPGKDALYAYKRGELTDDQYTELYRKKMNQSLKENPERWLEVIGKDELVIACYCPAGKYCHRCLLVGFFEKLCKHHEIAFKYEGEMLPP